MDRYNGSSVVYSIGGYAYLVVVLLLDRVDYLTNVVIYV